MADDEMVASPHELQLHERIGVAWANEERYGGVG
jgi:hypothetical protein